MLPADEQVEGYEQMVFILSEKPSRASVKSQWPSSIA